MNPEFFEVTSEKVVLKKDGRWFSNGEEITHKKTCEAFSKNLHWDETRKQYYVHIGYERLYVEVEDTAYFIVDFRLSKGAPFAKTNLGDEFELKQGAVLSSSDSQTLYALLPNGQLARLLSYVQSSLASYLEEENGHYHLNFGPKFSIAVIKR